MSTEDAPTSSPTPSLPSNLRVIVRPLPKVVFFHPVWILSAVFAFWPGELSSSMALAWLGVFFFNILVISFDFNEERSLILVLAGITTAVALLYFGVLGSVGTWLTGFEPELNRTVYRMMFSGFSVVFFFVWLNTRFNYWEFRPNEVIHRYGIFPKMKRYSTEDMRWDKTVPDLLERLLLGTGSITLTTPHEKHPVRLDHVPRIGTIDDRIADILGVKAVVHQEQRDRS